MAWWRKDSGTSGILLASIVEEGLLCVAGRREGDRLRSLYARLSLPRGSVGGDLRETLKNQLQWREEEPLFLVSPKPLLFGNLVVQTSARYEEGHAVVRDTRELLHAARWRAANDVREAAGQYFGVSLEDLRSVRTSLEESQDNGQNITASVFHVCAPGWGQERVAELQRLLPESRELFLPLALSEAIGNGTSSEALLMVDEDVSTLVVRQRGIPRHVRSISFGHSDVRAYVRSIVSCDDMEAQELLTAMDARTLPPDAQKTMLRILRRLQPLGGHVLATIAAALDVGTPARLVLRGPYPTVLATLFCRRQHLLKAFGAPVRCEASGPHTTESSLALLQEALRLLLFPVSERVSTPVVEMPTLVRA